MLRMRPVVSVAAVLLASACAGASPPPSVAPSSSVETFARETPAEVLGLLWDEPRASLARLDSVRLRAHGPVVDVPHAGAYAFSPDGRLLAVGGGDAPRLAFVDLDSMGLQGQEIELPGVRWVTGMLWEQQHRLVVLAGADDARVFTVDPRKGEVVGARRLAGTILASDHAGGRLVFLLAPTERIGQATFAVVESDGSVRTQRLPGIRAGFERIDDANDAYASRELVPGIAISPDGTRVLITPAAGAVAEVDLATLAVEYHELREPVSVLERLRDWFEPQAQAKVTEGPTRYALWFSDDLVAVTGVNYEGIEDGRFRTTPAGLRLIDTRDWTVRTIVAEATGIARVGDILLAFGGTYDDSGKPIKGLGLRAYDADGNERLHLFGNDLIGWPQIAWPYAYLSGNNSTRYQVVDLRDGRIVATPLAGKPITIIAATS